MEEVFAFYNKNISDCRRQIIHLRKKIHALGTIRLLIVLAAIAALWMFWEHGLLILGEISLAAAITFTILMIYHEKLAKKKTYNETLEQLCNNEIKSLACNFSSFDGASEYIDSEHAFSHDLDIFGTHSLFQSINRTTTILGKEQLASYLTQPLTNKTDILQRQASINELSNLTPLRQHFYVEGHIMLQKEEENRAPTGLEQLIPTAFGNKFWALASKIIPAGWIAIFIGTATSLIPPTVTGYIFFLSAIIANCRIKKINKLHRTVNNMEKIFTAYSSLMKIIEATPFETHILSTLRSNLSIHGTAASQAIRKLSSYIGILDQRATITGALLNIFTLRDIRASIAIEQWNRNYGIQSAEWFKALAHFDALASLAGFSFNHPDYTYPQIADEFRLSAQKMGHPLIPCDSCVRNDINIAHCPTFIIITGANMAGKSTYLRTIGINILLASTGAPVCAQSMVFYPSILATSLRTSDSLAGNESYFFAELKRLKKIIDLLRQGHELFIILDEILKGTNSIDKQKGSFALVNQLISLNASGIIATHDLALATLQQKLPENIQNYCFEADIIDNHLSFTYLLRQGVAENMNATFLMQQMGITL
ncbi:MAG: DNA mismatch repair protein MutS [Tannerellaceae bacterium]|jgi:hypothetical protein|nr:DNA mismatch repair protein MutS [Tannerellaceae bacterium]